MKLGSANVIWAAKASGRLKFWGSEADIQQLVVNVFIDAITAAGLQEQLYCFNELSIFKLSTRHLGCDEQ